VEFEKTILNVKFEGSTYTVRYPSTRKALIFSTEFEKVKDSAIASLEMIIDYLDGLGLPRVAAEEMEMHHLVEILEAFNSKKK
jgi:hypothetical protein